MRVKDLRQKRPRGGLFLGRDGIFEVEDDRIGGQVAGLLQRTFPRPRNIED